MKMRSLALLSLIAACGSSDKGGGSPPVPSCDDDSKAFKACGGDVVGSWTPTRACGNPLGPVNPLANQPECATSTWKVTGIAPSGTITFAADGTETDAFASTTSTSISLADACFTALLAGHLDFQTPGVDACTALQ